MNITELLTEKEKACLIYKDLKKDEVLFHEDDICEYVGIIMKGRVFIISYLSDGKEIIYNTLDKDQLFGNNLIFSSVPYYKGDIIAQSDSQIALIGKEDLLKILQNNKNFLKEYLKIQSDSSKILNDRIRLLSISSAEERFLYFMHENRNRVSYDSIEQLARQMYLARETLTRLLRRLESNNSIIRENKVIILK
ncbi:MAG: Crp/Fnr family transcriptional regulator [Erysipelotrichaceae bacterium]|nr:Crp/Fnr family transcriptional regulator [Erysipelotrichaceae bacterium]